MEEPLCLPITDVMAVPSFLSGLQTKEDQRLIVFQLVSQLPRGTPSRATLAEESRIRGIQSRNSNLFWTEEEDILVMTGEGPRT